ncbi:hypothetical protein BVG16_31350 [Paenibacillus selenitireducens]|uniref:Beta-lactamase-related domain-containing protein n=1 Tax=Paenibacillus selenitireducens TaxID=1324314 RepID=A0A1T2WZG0_9BACL|nr:serine hydrolase domain-containing protein [Paenibacillus selenitireducens]OPA72955.1 hypothetical protein BVG16_31350 [Paenibacillus selenitireducens]
MNTNELSHMELSTKLKCFMDALHSRGYFNGAVLAARNGQILLSQGYGMADFVHDMPNTTKTKFRLGAITKAFTVMAILQLQEQGKLSVDDFIDRYLPDYPNGNLISIHHLLSNASGITDYPGIEGYWEKTMRLYSTIDETISSFRDKPLLYTPGEHQNYCSSNYILLGSIIERVSGLTYADYISEKICQPLNMMNTGVEDGRSVLKHFASGYSVCKEIIQAEYVDMSIHLGAGAMYSTVEDLFLWDRALYTDVLVRKHSLKKLFEHYTPPCGSYGWIVSEQTINNRARKRIGHSGSMNGFWADFNRYVDEDMVIVVLSNINLTPVEIISQHLAQIALGEDVCVPEDVHPIQINPNEMKQYAGIYECGDRRTEVFNEQSLAYMNEALDLLTDMKISDIVIGRFHKIFQQYGISKDRTIVVTYEQGKLYLFMPKQCHGAWFKYEIIPVSKYLNLTTWIARNIDEQVVFEIDPSGEISFTHRDVNGNQVSARKIQLI